MDLKFWLNINKQHNYWSVINKIPQAIVTSLLHIITQISLTRTISLINETKF